MFYLLQNMYTDLVLLFLLEQNEKEVNLPEKWVDHELVTFSHSLLPSLLVKMAQPFPRK